MIVLAIDPGSFESAYLNWDGQRILSMGIEPNEMLLTFITACHVALGVDIIAIEQIAHYGTGMPAGRSVFDTCIWIGRFIERCPIPPVLIERRHIKMHLCGSARAKDANIRAALIDRLGAPGIKSKQGVTYGVRKHLWAALALSVYVHDTQGKI